MNRKLLAQKARSRRLPSAYSYKPAPFFVMDESDAALDSRNVKNIVRFIKCQANATKFIAVSHRESFYSCSDTLIGVATEVSPQLTAVIPQFSLCRNGLLHFFFISV